MQVAVHTLNLGVVGVYLFDNDRDRVIKLLCDIMASVAGNQLQTTALAGTGFDWLVDAVGLDGIIQLLVVVHLAVDGKGMIQKIKEISRVQADRKALALFGDRQVFQRLIVRSFQPVCEDLCDFYALIRAAGGFFGGSCLFIRRCTRRRFGRIHNF